MSIKRISRRRVVAPIVEYVDEEPLATRKTNTDDRQTQGKASIPQNKATVPNNKASVPTNKAPLFTNRSGGTTKSSPKR